ncbi:MAG: hypothetical protein N2112_00370 [Gemmataceae bacterium]|jgi:hypothetical protein|nr:hypothetical protein [Gemmataceae bacterium]
MSVVAYLSNLTELAMRLVATIFCLSLCSNPLLAQVKSPAAPKEYDVQLRYRISAERNQRVLIYEELSRFLKKIGFQDMTDPDELETAPFNPASERKTGVIESKVAMDLLRDPRIQTVLLAPKGFKYPEGGRVRLRISLNREVPRNEQLKFYKQVLDRLNVLGYKDELGYNREGNTILRGTFPADKTVLLLKDLRILPDGWLLPLTPNEVLPEPFKSIMPIRVVEVLGEAKEAPAEVTLPPIPEGSPQFLKFAPEIRRLMADETERSKPIRAEVLLAREPLEFDEAWRESFDLAKVRIEGRIGKLVTINAAQASLLGDVAMIGNVVHVRLPAGALKKLNDNKEPKKEPEGKKEPEPKKDPEEKKEAELKKENLQGPRLGNPEVIALPALAPDVDPVKGLGVEALHAAGKKGNNIRVLIIATDFGRYIELLGMDKDSPMPILIDFTTMKNRSLQADPMSKQAGLGTQAALAIRRLAPAAQLILVRLMPDAPYQVLDVIRYVQGQLHEPDLLRERRRDVLLDIDLATEKRNAAREAYRKAFDGFDPSEEAKQKRMEAVKNLKQAEANEVEAFKVLDRLTDYERELKKLVGVNVIVNLIGHNNGYPLDANSWLSRYLDDWLMRSKPSIVKTGLRRPPEKPLWFQPAGDTRGQVWYGLFRDANNDGVMEFLAPDEKLPPERWNSELNFLALRDEEGKRTLELPAKGHVRITVQWREPHDPTVREDEYREPIAKVIPTLIWQRDPEGKQVASDEIDVIARPATPPVRLHSDPNYGIYEQTLDVILPVAGRYALRMEGKVPKSIQPVGTPIIPAQEQSWELKPRIFIETLGGTSQTFVFHDYEAAEAGVDIPADARSVIAVAAAGIDKKLKPYASIGAGPSTSVIVDKLQKVTSTGQILTKTITEGYKPDLITWDVFVKPEDWGDDPIVTGSPLATANAAGVVAAMLSAGLQPSGFPSGLGLKPSQFFQVPEGFLKR